MQWQDRAFILETRPFGESDLIVCVLTHHHGRRCGFVHGGRGRRLRGVLQIGNTIDIVWRARLETQLGSFTVESITERTAPIFIDHPDRLTALSALCATLNVCLPENNPVPDLYYLTEIYADLLCDPDHSWQVAHILWELTALKALGHGLSLEKCAVTRTVDSLCFVSPRTGCAVTESVAGAYQGRLLPLPTFLRPNQGESQSEDQVSSQDLAEGWQLVDHFWQKCIFRDTPKGSPQARNRLAHLFMS